MSKNVAMLVCAVLFFLAAVAQVAHADETSVAPATVSVTYAGEEWKPGKALGICVQTGLRSKGLLGDYSVVFSFTTESVMTSRERFWGALSFLLIDSDENLISMAFGQEVGETAEELKQRAIGGDKLSPGGRYFLSTCETLTNTVVSFVPRAEVKE